MKKLIAILLTASSFLALHAEEKALALVVQTAGKSDLVRDGKTLGVKANDLVRKGDLLRTSKDASMSVQLSTGAIFRMGPDTEVALQDLVRDGTGFHVKLDVKKGQLASKLDQLSKKDTYQVQTPTAVAGVRGTSFIVEISSAVQSAEVLVSDGAVAVTDNKTGTEQVCPSGSKIVADGRAMIQSLVDEHEKEKFRIFADMKKFQRENFEQLIEQQKRNQEMMRQQREQMNMDSVRP